MLKKKLCLYLLKIIPGKNGMQKSRKAENHVRYKAYLEEILYNKGEKPNFGKVCKNFSAVNGHLLHNENRRVVFEKELQQLIKVNISKNI